MAGFLHIKKGLIDKTLACPPAQGKRLLEPLRSFAKENGVPFNILEDKEVTNDAEIHTDEGDLWMCAEGEVVFICGEELTNDKYPKKNKEGVADGKEWKAGGVKNGKEIILSAGDWLWIPAGEAHQHKTASFARLVIIKIPSRYS